MDGLFVLDGFLTGGETVRVGSTSLRVERLDARYTALPDAMSFEGVIGASREMRRLYPLCERLAQSDVPVVIEGETGTRPAASGMISFIASPSRASTCLRCGCVAATWRSSRATSARRSAAT